MTPHHDPDVQTLPDGTHVYTPGRKGRKLIAVIVGACVVLFGIWWQYEPARLFLFGVTTEARVAYVSEMRPGLDPVVHDTVKAVSETEDPTRNAVYYYYLRFINEDGDTVTARLNYGHTLRPLLTIGEFVTIAYDPDDPEHLYDKWSVRTWAFGFFFIAVGLLIFIPQLMIYLAANKPIVLDSIPDYDDLVAKGKV